LSGRDNHKRENQADVSRRSSSRAVGRDSRAGTTPPFSTERFTETATEPPSESSFAERDEREFDSLSDELNRWPEVAASPRVTTRGSEFESTFPRVDEPFLDEASIADSSPPRTGYYSLRPSSPDVVIPPAPRVPTLNLDTIEAISTSFPGAREKFYSQPPEDRVAETIRTPAPGSISSFAPPASQSEGERGRRERVTSVPPSSFEGPKARRTRLYLAPHLRIQAERWLTTGSLTLPGSSSDRHSRALERALLLAMLHEPGWALLPDGLQQRVQRRFCDGWESSGGLAHPFREIDDLAMVLGFACTRETRAEIAQAINGHLPALFPSGPTSRPPPSFR
jgi:hypothetical protein